MRFKNYQGKGVREMTKNSLVKNALVGQSGGPTVAINASLSGVVGGAQSSKQIKNVYGTLYGIEGILKGNIINMSECLRTVEDYNLLEVTPSMALGSCRYKLPDFVDESAPYYRILEVFKEYDIGFFFYIGGNDSMDTVVKLDGFFKAEGADIKVVGVPKTIDNDLPETDHTPGFGSAAKFVATAMSEITLDANVYDTKSVTIVEIMGRNSGWLTAASALARSDKNPAPHFIYLPEVAFSVESFLQDLTDAHKTFDNLVLAVSEGIKFADGRYVSSCSTGNLDAFGHSMLSGTGKYLETVVQKKIGCKVRSIELSVLQRSAAHILSMTDINEARQVGIAAVNAALEGESGMVIAIERVSNIPYLIKFTSVPAQKVANFEKAVPFDWINTAGNDVNSHMLEYLKPLVLGEINIPTANGIPRHFTLGRG